MNKGICISPTESDHQELYISTGTSTRQAIAIIHPIAIS